MNGKCSRKAYSILFLIRFIFSKSCELCYFLISAYPYTHFEVAAKICTYKKNVYANKGTFVPQLGFISKRFFFTAFTHNSLNTQ